MDRVNGQLPALAKEADVLAAVIELVRARLPRDWSATVEAQSLFGPDAVITIAAPDEMTGQWAILVKRTVLTRDVLRTLEQLREAVSPAPNAERPPLRRQSGPEAMPPTPVVAARYLPATVREELEARATSYVDATGNMNLALARPGLFIRDLGATTDPWRGPGRPRGTLKGEPAARVVRALADYEPPYSLPELAKLANASTGGVYRVVEFLEQQTLVEREPRGPITDVRWSDMLIRWSRDFSFVDSKKVYRYVSARGIEDVLSQLAANEGSLPHFAMTGSYAAEPYGTVAPTRMLMIYADEPAVLARAVGLREVSGGADVLIVRPQFDVVYERTNSFGRGEPGQSLPITATSQTVVDLLTGPGRNPAQGEALLEWMRANVREWRRPVPELSGE